MRVAHHLIKWDIFRFHIFNRNWAKYKELSEEDKHKFLAHSITDSYKKVVVYKKESNKQTDLHRIKRVNMLVRECRALEKMKSHSQLAKMKKKLHEEIEKAKNIEEINYHAKGQK